MQIKPWITAARLRTLPLGISNIILGSFLAYNHENFRPVILLLGLATAFLLQILSNYANDYGDFIKGADENRVSTYERSLQSGKITPQQMRWMLIVLSLLTFATGISLVAVAVTTLGIGGLVAFVVLGIMCIVAAITYTIGKKPYGYSGMGDISVFLFFGIVGVCGIYVLQTQQWNWLVLLPAASLGLLTTGVLNINNIRDIESDRISGKNTLVVKIGREKAIFYHTCLIIGALLLGIISTLLDFQSAFQFLYLSTLPFFILNIFRVRNSTASTVFDKELRNLSLATFFYSVIFGLGLIL
jgi:1,4-dihydroxy-2-naphthoate polyprenyltransferase